jgi:Alpha/beta hydrolase domain
VSRIRTPIVSGPVSGGRGSIFGSPMGDPTALGFVMEEYFLEGTALSYAPTRYTELGLDGMWQVEPADEASYKTRLYVVRPADPARFNGIVLVNWQNVTIGADFGMPDVEQLERGYGGPASRRNASHTRASRL